MIGKKSKSKDMAQSDNGASDESRANDADSNVNNEAVNHDVAVTEETPDALDLLRGELEQWKDKFLRAKAEQQNALRRAENQARESVRFANADLLRSLLDVADDLDRTLEVAGQDGSADASAKGALVEGVRIIQGKIGKILADNGVTAIEAVGQAFDPSLHEAMMQQPSDKHEAGTVIQQLQTGYQLHNRVLRPAKVIVASAKPADEADEE